MYLDDTSNSIESPWTIFPLPPIGKKDLYSLNKLERDSKLVSTMKLDREKIR